MRITKNNIKILEKIKFDQRLTFYLLQYSKIQKAIRKHYRPMQKNVVNNTIVINKDTNPASLVIKLEKGRKLKIPYNRPRKTIISAKASVQEKKIGRMPKIGIVEIIFIKPSPLPKKSIFSLA